MLSLARHLFRPNLMSVLPDHEKRLAMLFRTTACVGITHIDAPGTAPVGFSILLTDCWTTMPVGEPSLAVPGDLIWARGRPLLSFVEIPRRALSATFWRETLKQRLRTFGLVPLDACRHGTVIFGWPARSIIPAGADRH